MFFHWTRRRYSLALAGRSLTKPERQIRVPHGIQNLGFSDAKHQRRTGWEHCNAALRGADRCRRKAFRVA